MLLQLIARSNLNNRNKKKKLCQLARKTRNKTNMLIQNGPFEGQESVIKPIGELARVIEQTSSADMLRFLVAFERKRKQSLGSLGLILR